ncbi:glycosyl hydrolase [Planosporangium thailandense]|uniref:Glycosyl hydrolase n=1 Tax=Planosporangium thailandense TaxID=765197 RepID=A0ABX0XTS8_9ACTN|nr:glycoside hydrolase family 3 C-terminal domain-containing protein [Planosporangium thailandense]NJC68633.1 glycosyl hydrolase [Planosporangium thailandense]
MRCRIARLLAAAVMFLFAMTAPALPAAGSPPAVGSPSALRPWMRPGLSPAQRADRLLARMTLDEKIAMVHGVQVPPTARRAGQVPGNRRLGIPDLVLADGPNGVGNGNTGVTAFPTENANAAAWDPTLTHAYGRALGAEQAGKGHNVALAPTLNILRTPLWGRAPEAFTEDPYLNGQTAAAEVSGIQRQHVIATPKHFVANNQETGRQGVPVLGGPTVDELISQRALQEIYYPGFAASVHQGGAGAVMCAYNRINGVYACENPQTLGTLKAGWGFDGFVMSDWAFATHDTVAAANAGMDQEMPLGTHFGNALKEAVLSGAVPMSRLDDMVRRILTAMFRIGVFDHPVSGNEAAMVSSPAHRLLARRIAEQGSVLLRNEHGALPLDAGRLRSLAVIGADAGDATQIGEGGSGTVVPSGLVTPLAGITARAGSGVRVSYAPGTLGAGPLPVLPASRLTPAAGSGPGLLGTYYATPDLSGAPVATRVDRTLDTTAPPVAGLPTVWSARWTGTFTPPATGDYRFSLAAAGAYRLCVDGRQLADNKYADFPATAAPAPVHLTAGRPVPILVDYSPAQSVVGTRLHLGWQPPAPALRQRAVDAARGADAAVVFAGDAIGEGTDRTDLALPGDSDQLIHDVAAANPRTVVVLNTGAPVLMPWLHEVAGAIEAWYPGQESGNAIAALLFGDVNPSGRLPMTWPASARQGPVSSYDDLHRRVEPYDEGILVGYRWYDATAQRPLFPFGYGLSYTTFRYSDLRIAGQGRNATVSVRVTNSGRRPGAEVAQLYLGAPPAAQEPPKQLKGYQKVTLEPGESTRVSFHLDAGSFASYDTGLQRWTVHAGTYQVMVGGSSRDVRAAGWLAVT